MKNEPYISLNDLKETRPAISKSIIYQIGVAGFCFGNIMLISFPEYLGVDASEEGLRGIFRWANFVLALPVLLYSALPFYESSWKSLKTINITGSVSDNKYIHEIHVHVTDIDTGEEYLHVHIHPATYAASFHQPFTAQSGINYKIIIIAHDLSVNVASKQIEVSSN